MISIQCEKCQAQFQIDETKLPAKAAKGRCGKCGHVFTLNQTSEITPAQTTSTNLDDLFSGAAEEANAPSAPSFQVSKETMKKYQSKVNQSFKKSSHQPLEPLVPEIALSKKDIHKHAALFTLALVLLFLFSSMLKTGTIRPKNLWLSWIYRQAIQSQKINIIDVRPGFYQSSTSKKYFHLSGKLYNASGVPLAQAAKIKAKIFSPSDTPLGEVEVQSGDKPLNPGDMVDFNIKSEISSEADVGSYTLSVVTP